MHTDRGRARLPAPTPPLPPLLQTIYLPRQLASAIGLSFRRFAYIVYVIPGTLKYRQFNLPKRSRGERLIEAPRWPLLRIQHALRPLVDELYRPRGVVHGFLKERSILTNARVHLKARWVLSLDLQDFFHSVTFGRIKGRLEANPFNLTAPIAHALANAACVSGRLPQGGALSPVLSNMVADRLDGELSRLCRKFRCRYTRYADDITISTGASKFPHALAHLDDSERPTLIIGDALRSVIESNDFKLNESKSRLSGRGNRQEVTGLIVNEKLNVPRTFVRQIRAMMHAWEKFGREAAEEEHLTKWRKSEGRLRKHDQDDFEFILRGKLEFLKSVQGEIEPVCRKLLLRFNGLPDRRTAAFRLLPASSIELLKASTYCLDIVKYVGPSTGGSAPVREHFTGTAFFLKGVGLVTCEHCTGDEMQIYHPDRKHMKYRVRPLKADALADVAILEVLDTMLPPPSVELEASATAAAIGDEVRVAGFPAKFPEGSISIARTEVIATYDRSRHPIWMGDTTVRYLIEKGIPDGVSGGPALDARGAVIGLGAKGPSEGDPLVPCEVIPISAVQRLLFSLPNASGPGAFNAHRSTYSGEG